MTHDKPPAVGLAPTAGLRGAAWGLHPSPPDLEVSLHPLLASDGGTSFALLAQRGSPRAVLFLMHPREFTAVHYLVPALTAAGYAVWTQAPRSIGNDIRLEHETALLDVAAGMRALEALGHRSVVMLGNSGGASLLTFYQEQAVLSPEARLARTPGGRPVTLSAEAMPRAAGFVYVSPHMGQGRLLMAMIDGSLTDERDPFSVDPALDPFDRANGFRRPPEGARYQPAFIAAYRAAQRARVSRLDAMARKAIADKRAAVERLKAGDRAAAKAAAHTPVMEIWRTDADPRNWDLSLEPSGRTFGGLWGSNPAVSNFGTAGFARLCTPESWLSSWSALSSNADLGRTAKSVDVPSLTVIYDADPTFFASDQAELQAALSGGEASRVRVPGNHHGLPETPEDGPGGREEAAQAIAEWLRRHFR